MSFNKVVFPAPFSPRIPILSVGPSSKEISSKILLLPKDLERISNEIVAVARSVQALQGKFSRISPEEIAQDSIRQEWISALGKAGEDTQHLADRLQQAMEGLPSLSASMAASGVFVAQAKMHLEEAERRLRITVEIFKNRARFAQGVAEKKPIDLLALIKQSAKAYIWDESVVPWEDVEFVAEGNGPWMIEGDRITLLNAFHNLIVNAGQAMAGRKSTLARITLAREEGHIRVSIEDTGPGIREDLLYEGKLPDRERVYDLDMTTKPGGTGLGATEAWHAFKLHGAALEVSSWSENGTIFQSAFLEPRSEVRLPDESRLKAEEESELRKTLAGKADVFESDLFQGRRIAETLHGREYFNARKFSLGVVVGGNALRDLLGGNFAFLKSYVKRVYFGVVSDMHDSVSFLGNIIDINRDNNNLIHFLNKYGPYLFGPVVFSVPIFAIREVQFAFQAPQFGLFPWGLADGLCNFSLIRSAIEHLRFGVITEDDGLFLLHHDRTLSKATIQVKPFRSPPPAGRQEDTQHRSEARQTDYDLIRKLEESGDPNIVRPDEPWHEVARGRLLIIDVGPSAATKLREVAENHPEYQIIGIERDPAEVVGLYHLLKYSPRPSNYRVMFSDDSAAFKNQKSPAADIIFVSAPFHPSVNYFFSDPNSEKMLQAIKILKPNGHLIIVPTTQKEDFDFLQKILNYHLKY